MFISRIHTSKFLLAAALVLGSNFAAAYPLDGIEEAGIRRLEGFQISQQTPAAAKLAAGQLWATNQIGLRLLGYDGPDFDTLPEDPQLKTFLEKALKNRDPSYAMVLVDIADPNQLRWAGLRPDLKQNVGSVGKIICMAALFHVLAENFPDTDDRARVLRESVSPAGDWVSNEIHQVPKWNAALQRNLYSVVNSKDSFRLSEWLDHAMSASANGAATIVWREAMLIRHFGSEYPKSFEESEQYFTQTPKTELARSALAVVTEPLASAGLDTKNMQQGSFWTSNSKRKVPGTVSFATPREISRFMFRIEQGKLVDEWSSLQMKKYLYLTKRRYRYAYAPELNNDAVFFKSGSLYSCGPEEGFTCQKYMGNVRNMMNSVAMVESQSGNGPTYLVSLLSNVLRVNSAWDHSRIAAAVHQTLRTNTVQALRESASKDEMLEAGKSE